jgi:hypothetical protein
MRQQLIVCMGFASRIRSTPPSNASMSVPSEHIKVAISVRYVVFIHASIAIIAAATLTILHTSIIILIFFNVRIFEGLPP